MFDSETLIVVSYAAFMFGVGAGLLIKEIIK